MANRRNAHTRSAHVGAHSGRGRRMHGYTPQADLHDFSNLGANAPRRGRKTGGSRRGGFGKPESALDKKVTAIPTSNGEILLTRRHFLYGAAGVAALAAAGTGAKVLSDRKKAENEISVLTVPQSAVTESTDLTEVENGGKLYEYANLKLPYGTLIWSNTDNYAATLIPTDTGSPLTSVGLLRISSGYHYTVLSQAVGLSEGFEIYDVRCSDEGLVWTEVDILDGVWRIYGASLSDEGSLGTAQLLDEGDSEWETPSIGICGKKVYWQVLPDLNGSKKSEPSLLRSCVIGQAEPSIVLSSTGRMSTPIYTLDQHVVVTPRVDTTGVYHQLTLIDSETDDVADSLVLPQSMKPLEAGYGSTGFMFSFEGIYSYGDGIANLGTYAPLQDTRFSDYSAASWLHFARTPSAAPCWCGRYLIVKSTRSVVCIDGESDTYFLFDVASGAASYGDYLASTGIRTRIVVYTNVDDTPLNGASEQYCSVRVYSA